MRLMSASSTVESLSDGKQTAEYLRLKERAFWRLVNEAGLPCYRLNKRVVRFRLTEVQQWLNKHREGV
jgi:excisionase family DNA binding protein